MTIEITKGENNPVTDFFSSPSRTPNTDDLARGNHAVPTEWAEQLERERDDANQIISSALAVLPVGYISAHTAESIPHRISDLCNEIAKLERERDEARGKIENLKLQLGLWEDGNLICEETLGEIRLLEERIEEAQKELSSIHQWIDRNHADGFIDSLTYFQNLERVTDNWYDRLDRLEVDAKRFVRERDEARHKLELCMAANSDVARIAKERDEAREKYDTLAVENMLEVNKLCKERDEAKSISDDLAIIASHCLGWHDHESSDTKIKIAAALKRWKKSKLSNEQD
jgi:chromosome segregation ATPase